MCVHVRACSACVHNQDHAGIQMLKKRLYDDNSYNNDSYDGMTVTYRPPKHSVNALALLLFTPWPFIADSSLFRVYSIHM
jgi:hypothetical protein